jgi:hypothetical protein
MNKNSKCVFPRRINSPCYQCKIREINCHSKCKEYLAYKVLNEKYNAKIKKIKDEKALADSFLLDMTHKCKRTKQRQR